MSELAVNRTRGPLLTIWLIFMALANAWTVYRYITIIEDFVSHSDPLFTGTLEWALPLLVVLAAANLVAVVLLWLWRKIGLYIFAATSAVALVINLLLGIPLLTSLIGLIGLAILWALLRPRWGYFR